MIPTRAYFLPNQTSPFYTVLDACAVAMLNKLCEETNAQIVVHSSWRKSSLWKSSCSKSALDVLEHLVNQGVNRDHFHEDWNCPFKLSSTRWQEIQFWLKDHPEIQRYVILEDEEPPDAKFSKQLCPILFEEGFTYGAFVKARDILKD